MNIPTPLRRTSKIHHISSVKKASFDPDPVTPCSTGQSHLRLVCRWLTYSSFWWCWYLRRWSSFSQYQSTNNTSQTQPLTINFQNNSWCPGIPRRRWRRGFPDCTLGWWTLDYWRRPQQNFMHTWTFLTTWTMPVPMPICKLPASFLCWDHGFEWHFWFWGYHDHIQWWGHTCTWRFSILKELWFALNIRYWL